MNKVNLIGRVATNIESRVTQSGIAQANFRLAVNRPYKNAEGEYEADFLTIVCWRGTAELAQKYLHNGDRCAISGAIQTRSWTDNSGNRRSVVEIVADSLEFLESGKARRGQKPEEEREAPPEPTRPQRAEQTKMGFTEVDVDEDELPF